MSLHCSSRLGFVSYLYQQRHEIAFSLGLTAEKVIAMCNGDYHQQTTLVSDQSNHETAPVPQALEINLFFAVVSVISDSSRNSEMVVGNSHYHSGQFGYLPPDIFIHH